jgi:hypothetical protein
MGLITICTGGPLLETLKERDYVGDLGLVGM